MMFMLNGWDGKGRLLMSVQNCSGMWPVYCERKEGSMPRLITEEMGKIIRESLARLRNARMGAIIMPVMLLSFYGPRFIAKQMHHGVCITYQPLG